MKIEDVLSETKEYLSSEDNKNIRKAYDFAVVAHGNQKRGTGDPYIVHPLNVSLLLAKDRLDTNTICAALLHDVAEDNPECIKDMKNTFNEDVCNLVNGVTKLGKIKIKKSWFLPLRILQNKKEEDLLFERHVESLRKMFMAMSKDMRIVLIKLADRYHNMQTLEGVSQAKRQRIARETLEIYAPLAHRLGMGKIKGELEDLAFPFAYPEEFKNLKKIVGPTYEKKEKYISKIKYLLREEFKKNNISIIEINGRKKHFYSLYRKLNKYNHDFDKIYDLVALRIIVDSTEECYQVLGVIHSLWKPLIGRIKDYIALPKPNGYRSLHTTIFGPEGEIFEVQIRTQEMHDQAEYGIAAHWHYSDNKSSKTHKEYKINRFNNSEIKWMEDLANWQRKANDKKEWEKGVKMDFFQDRIFTFTPQGDVFDLPLGATPIDFAYAIHSEVGSSCVGAKVNGKIVSLNNNLKNGDIVDIITSKKTKPKRDWLNLVKTQRARNRIKSSLNDK